MGPAENCPNGRDILNAPQLVAKGVPADTYLSNKIPVMQFIVSTELKTDDE